ncbi:chorismate dehydratase [Vulcanimicrobium alpinum]|uniref:Chorismate dehydratase n=1 Tax=Vulcanimicrobium alpinum TaxID=3016050 RepID=A0AAN1XWD3_UNVUL|nr:menaquinone biosynthesis protein [Vulcanimicrobium alpinum]BDE05498.1 chorismate dehydratase [Vulcanimicrobium alpinum]
MPALSNTRTGEPLRYGRMGFVNVAPIETAFDAGAVARDVVEVSDVPTRLNAMLVAGELDVAAISAAHYLAHRDELALLGDCCIASDGPVRSVLLVSPIPPALLEGASIAVTAQSASGRALLATLLEHVQHVRPTYDVVDDALGAARAGRPALIIGDDALVARGACPPAQIHDLGEAWSRWTGLPFVFAVWAVRRDVARRRPAEVAALAAALAEARAWGTAHRDAVIEAAIARKPFHRGLYADYFTRLRYVLDERAQRGLARFADLFLPKEPARVPR